MPEIEDTEQAHSVGAEDSQVKNNIKLVVDLGDKRTMEIPRTGKLVVDLQENSGAVSTVNSVGVKDSQNNVKLVVDLGDKRAMEIPLTGKLVIDAEDTDQMRGWMMTVATLFVTLAYQAVTQPPRWMPNGDWLEVESASSSSSHADPPAMPAPSPSPPPAITARQARLAYAYVSLNTFTFGTALALVIVLILLKKNPPPTHTTSFVKIYMVLVAFTVASTFIMGHSDVPRIMTHVSISVVINAVVAILYVIFGIPQWVLSIAKNIHMYFTRLKKFLLHADYM